MSIQKKSYTSKKTGKTVIQYCAVVYNPMTKKYEWSKRCETKKEARQFEQELLVQIERGTIKNKVIKFDDLLQRWFEVAILKYADSTYRGYYWYSNKYLLPAFADKKVQDIQPDHIQKFITAMSKKYSAETINKNINILSDVFQFGQRMYICNLNPCERVTRAKVVQQKTETWDERQIIYFLGLPSVKASMYYDMLIVSFTLGVRPSELCGIAESDFVNNGVLTLNRGFNRYGNMSELKTDSSHRMLELSDLLVKLLNKRLSCKKRQRLQFGIDNDFLFTNTVGQPVNPNNYSKGFKKLLRTHNRQIEALESELGTIPSSKMKLPDIRLYDARHSFATNNILSASASIKVISEILGHANVKTTLHTYSHVTQSMNKKAIDDYSDKILGRVTI